MESSASPSASSEGGLVSDSLTLASSWRPLVSVVIATYNMGRYLPGAIESILAQTYPRFEIIVVDDGSTDDTRECLLPYTALSNVRVIHQKNMGQPKAKNAGIALSSGELIAFCDADDLWAPNKLEMQVPCFLNRSELAVVSSEIGQIDVVGHELGARRVNRYSGRILEHLLIRNCISFGTAIVRKDVLDDVGWFDEDLPMGIDWDLWLRIAVKYEFLHLDAVTYWYRVWPGQMSRNHRGRYVNAFLILDKFFKAHGAEVSSRIRKRAYADSYIGRARIVFEREGLVLGPLRDVLTAIRLTPLSGFAWKSLLKLAMNRR